MKVIDLGNRVIFVDDIISLYNEYKCGEYTNYYCYYIITKHEKIPVSEHYYIIVKEYLLSLNDVTKDDTPKEDKKIEKFYFSVYQDEKLGGREVVETLENKINEIIDKINGEENENNTNEI